MDTNNTTEQVPQTPAPAPVAAAVASQVRYAGFWLRFLAVVIDGILLGIVSAGVAAVFGISSRSDSTQFNAISTLLGLIYYTLMESSQYQGTLGKMALGIKVTDLNGARISLPKAIVRYLCKIISAIILFIGFIMAAFTEKKQGLHDMIAGTLVVKK